MWFLTFRDNTWTLSELQLDSGVWGAGWILLCLNSGYVLPFVSEKEGDSFPLWQEERPSSRSHGHECLQTKGHLGLWIAQPWFWHRRSAMFVMRDVVIFLLLYCVHLLPWVLREKNLSKTLAVPPYKCLPSRLTPSCLSANKQLFKT